MNSKLSQSEKATILHQLHHNGKLLVLPNIWDVLGARLLQDLNYPAIATASASISYANGFNDGEKMPFNDVLEVLKKIAGAVNLPVTADIESGYSNNDFRFEENIKQIIKTGVAGINIEDTDHETGSLNSTELQTNRIRIIRKVADELKIPLFINARTDVYLNNSKFPTPALKFEETLKRGFAYKEAGANCFYPIILKDKVDIQNLVSQLQMPVNILTIPGIPDLKTLNEIGVARVSLGPSFLKIAINAMKKLALDLKEYEGLSTITENEITSDYLKSLIDN